MDMFIQPTIAGAAFAALAVAGGAPLFSDGLRAFRLRRQFERLGERPLDDEPLGFVHTRGRVLLDSPLFSPLSGKPCAGFRLEVQGQGMARATVIEQRRPFRIVGDKASARVMAGAARWEVGETVRREVAPDEPLSENLKALLDRSPDASLIRLRRVPMVLIERALFAGVESHVIGHVRHARPFEIPSELEMMRTGTDDVSAAPAAQSAHAIALVTEAEDVGADEVPAPPSRSTGPFGRERRVPGRPFPGDVDLWVDGGGLLDYMLVSDTAPAREQLEISRWRMLGLTLGPALSLTGLLYLAHAADQLRIMGRF